MRLGCSAMSKLRIVRHSGAQHLCALQTTTRRLSGSLRLRLTTDKATLLGTGVEGPA